MKKEKLIKIVNHNEYFKDEISQACFIFYSNIGRKLPTVIPDIQTVAEMIFAEKGYRLVRIPLKNDEIGAFQLRLNGYNYLLLNTAKNMAYINYSIAHELYHILIQKNKLNSLDIYKEEYSEDKNEQMANAFAGNVLMPEEDFIITCNQISRKMASIENVCNINFFNEYFMITMLMNYFRTTYMSVVVRCFELKIFDMNNDRLLTSLLKHNNKEVLSALCNQYSAFLDKSSIAEISYIDDFESLLNAAETEGKEKIKRGLLSLEDYEYKIEGMRKAYMEVVKDKCQ